jgi:hypothetical protein
MKFGLVPQGGSKITWLPLLHPYTEIEGILHPSVAMNEAGMICIVYQLQGSNQIMCIAGQVKFNFAEEHVDLALGPSVSVFFFSKLSPRVLNLLQASLARRPLPYFLDGCKFGRRIPKSDNDR